ncbi:ABC-type multidrug transport system fused ATPase/permease subunit [Mumia flava]|uniref:ABC-type multidrug transport system fused ATPase/permease subunit n=1 Tax=Mumia flava TaxID=1348852 RepID=A0A0B2BA10_9ACTN|nr:ABC transporter ATP-binding protein [Mumia flava]PJJ53726.1 ABC-type multidrug transport system fused ATPase/permease subunit [Mumia flava]
MGEGRRLSDRPDETSALARSARYLRGHRTMLAVSTVVNVAAAGARVGGFALAGVVTDAILAGDRARVWEAAAVLTVLVVVSFAATWCGTYLVVRVGEAVVRDLREDAYRRVAAAPLRFLENHRSGDLVRRLTGEIAALSQFVGATLPALVNSSLMVLLTVVLLAGYSWLLTLVLVVLAALGAALLVRQFLARAPSAFTAVAAAEAQVSARFSETLPAREQLMVLGAQGRRLETFATDNDRLLRARVEQLRAHLWLVALGPVGGLLVVVLIALAAGGTAAGWLSVGGAVVFLLAARNAFGDVQELVAHLGDLRAARTHLARVLDLVEATEPDPLCPDESRAPGGRGHGVLEARKIGYAYGGRDALTDVDLEIHPGERVALVGRTGSGKTTLGKILAGLYQPDVGTVLLDDAPLSSLGPDTLRSRVVLIPQEVVLVSGTVADNLAMVPTDLGADPYGRMHAAATSLGLASWLGALSDGLDTPVGDHGRLVSAGERQLIALVRAALVDPEVLVLDEATADVDPVTAARVEDALARAARTRSVIVIAHRPDTVRRADRRIELVAGRVST